MLVTILGGLTQYYFYIFACIVTLVAIGYLLFTKEIKKMIIYAIQSASSVIIAFIIFPSVFDHVTSTSRGTEVLGSVRTTFSFDKVSGFLKHISKQIFAGDLKNFVMIIVVLVGIAVFTLISHTKFKKNYLKILFNFDVAGLLMIFISSSIYFIVVSQVSPYQTSRYIYSIYPSIILLAIVFMYHVLNIITKSKSMSIALLTVGIMLISLKGLIVNEPEHLKLGMNNNHQTIQELTAEGTNEAMLITDSAWRLSSTVNELSLFDSVYPAVINNDDNLPMDAKFGLVDSIVVYIFNDYDNEELQKNI